MKDQAENLRKIIDKINTNDAEKKKISRVITVTSGKGGVGKTNFTINLAIKLAEIGKKIIVIDADLGLCNIDVIMGITTKYNLLDVVNNNMDIAEILETGPCGIRFLSGGSGVLELAKLNSDKLKIIIDSMSKLDDEADIILIDTGAGLSDNVLSFVYAADEVIVIVTPEPTSITDAYAIIKTIVSREKDKNVGLVVNMADNEREGINVLEKLSMVTRRFLSFDINKLGFVVNDTNVSKAVRIQQPFVISYKRTLASKNIENIALRLTNDNEKKQQNGIKNFLNKFMKFF